MFGIVPLQPRALADYAPVAGERACQEVAAMGRALRGVRVLHLSALASGTYVADLLRALVPLMNAVGVAAEWQVIPTPEECRAAGDALYRALAEGQKGWTNTLHAGWLRYATASAALFDRDYDFVVVHDAQILPLLAAKAARDGARPPGRWLWHCHLDLTAAAPEAWGALRPHILQYDAALYAAHEHVRADTGLRRVVVVPPVIDPLSPRNAAMADEQVQGLLRRYAVDPRRPLICQVAPISRQTDPIGLLDAFQLLKPQVRGVQLALIWPSVPDAGPERSFFDLVAERSRQDEDVRVLSRLNGVGDVEVNAFERGATLVVQRSLPWGFSPGLLEAMWKGRAVVGGRTGAIPLQIVHGKTGYLAGTLEEFGLRMLDLLEDPEARARMGRAGHDRVRRGMLITRCLRDYLALFQSFL